MSPSGKISRPKFDRNSSDYKELRDKLIKYLKEKGYTAEEFLSGKA